MWEQRVGLRKRENEREKKHAQEWCLVRESGEDTYKTTRKYNFGIPDLTRAYVFFPGPLEKIITFFQPCRSSLCISSVFLLVQSFITSLCFSSYLALSKRLSPQTPKTKVKIRTICCSLVSTSSSRALADLSMMNGYRQNAKCSG